MLRLFIFSVVFCSLTSVAKVKDDGSQIQADNYYPRVKIETSMGDFVIELDRSRAPISTNNFLRYVDKRSYEGTIFHRVVVDFVVQGGGYDRSFVEKPAFPEIINESGNGLKNEMHTVSMARQNQPHSANRQFFINVNDNVSLDPGKEWGYAVFGYVVEGSDTVDAISQVKTDVDPTYGWADVPVEPVILKRASVLPQF